eukprot:scpid62069/ scgid7203/ 
MAISRQYVKNLFLVGENDLLQKSQLLTQENPRILNILKVLANLQISRNASETSPQAIAVKRMIKELSPPDRIRLADRLAKKSVPYGKAPKPMLYRFIADSYSEDGSLWLNNTFIGGIRHREACSIYAYMDNAPVRQSDPKQFAQPFLETLLCDVQDGHSPAASKISIVVRFTLNCLTLTPHFVSLLRLVESHINSTSLDLLAPTDRFRICRVLINSTQVHPNPDSELLKLLFLRMPDIIEFSKGRMRTPNFAEFVLSQLAFRVRHSPTLAAIADSAVNSQYQNLPLLTYAVLQHAAYRQRHAALEERALEYVRERRAYQLMMNPVTICQLAWGIMALRGGDQLPDELAAYATSAALRYVRDDVMAVSVLPYIEQIADAMPIVDAGQRAALEHLLHKTSLLHHARSRKITTTLSAATGGRVLSDVQLGPLYVHCACLVDPRTHTTLAWPQGLSPADIEPGMALDGGAIPVALLVISELDRRRLKPNVLMGQANCKRLLLEQRGWHVATVSEGDLSLRNAWFPENSSEIYPIDDALVLKKAIVAASMGRTDNEEEALHDDIFLGESDLGSYERYDKDFLDVLFARELGETYVYGNQDDQQDLSSPLLSADGEQDRQQQADE